MPGEKAVCVLLPNNSPVKGTIHFEQVSGEFLTFTEDMSVQRAFAIRDFLTCCKLLATVKLKFLLFFKSFETAESMLGSNVSIYREKNAFCVIFFLPCNNLFCLAMHIKTWTVKKRGNQRFAIFVVSYGKVANIYSSTEVKHSIVLKFCALFVL